LLNRRGVVAGMFFLGYGLFRIALENVREPDDYMPNFPLGLTMGMMLSAPMLLFGAWLIWRGLMEPLPEGPSAARLEDGLPGGDAGAAQAVLARNLPAIPEASLGTRPGEASLTLGPKADGPA
jgi:hypothetical protein